MMGERLCVCGEILCERWCVIKIYVKNVNLAFSMISTKKN